MPHPRKPSFSVGCIRVLKPETTDARKLDSIFRDPEVEPFDLPVILGSQPQPVSWYHCPVVVIAELAGVFRFEG
jgi:hypothetical protein